MSRRRLIDDCFLHDRERMRHDEVLALLAERLTPIADTETVGLDETHGLYLARSALAPRDVPLADNAAVDGYAFAYADYYRHNSMHVVARVAAGSLAETRIERGEAVRIFTGAPMPHGADTVAMQEDCEISADGGTVTVPKGLKPGANRRRAGEDVTAGSEVVSAGTRLRPQDVAALASLGFGTVEVHAPLKVAVLSTGDELVAPGTAAFRPGQVFDSNRAMMKALAATLPLSVTDLGILPDSRERIETVLAGAAATHDAVLTTGGASLGEEDHMVTALDTLGKRHLWQIAVKPGRPMTFGQIDSGGRDCVFFGLPGNPVAAFVCFLLYVRPALIRLGGGIAPPVLRFPLPAAFDIARKKRDRREFLRGWLEADEEGRTCVRKFPRDGSGLISGLRLATGLIELDEETDQVRPGDMVNFLPFSGFGICG